MIEVGLDCYQTFQPEIYDVEAVKREFGRDLAFWGGISTQQLLPYAMPERVKEETRRMIDVMGKEGCGIPQPSFRLNDACATAARQTEIPADVPPENILAMLEVFENQ